MVDQLITEKDILDYLMTSDFNEGLTQEESKFLLLKYRNFYRIMHSKCENLKCTISDLKSDIEKDKNSIRKYIEDIKNIEMELETEKSRKLTWKERFFGIKKVKF